MGRLPRPTGDDSIYHAINRGNNRADVLGPDGERDMFLGDLVEIRCQFVFSGKNDELTPDFPPFQQEPNDVDEAAAATVAWAQQHYTRAQSNWDDEVFELGIAKMR